MRDLDGLRLAHDHGPQGQAAEEALDAVRVRPLMLTESTGDELPRRSWASSRCSGSLGFPYAGEVRDARLARATQCPRRKKRDGLE